MSGLDNPKAIEKYDISNMLGILGSFSDQCKEAVGIGNNFRVPDPFRSDHKNIVFTGMGGSAIGADIIRSYLSDKARVPIIVNRNYTLPAFVDAGSLVIASSYSGNTEETLGAYKDARSRNAKVIAITSGGELERLAKQDGFPVIKIPGALPPRCALGYSFFTALVLVSKIGIVEDQGRYIDEAISGMRRLKDKKLGNGVSGARNIAKTIAGKLYGKHPVVYSSNDHIDCVTTRWRGQLAENSKVLASSHVFPEMDHNEIVGWENPRKLLKGSVAIFLRDSGDSVRIAKRIDVTKKIIAKRGFDVLEVSSEGESLLARIFSLVYIGDFVSFYLAVLNKRDPTPVECITYLKEELSKI
jgi:glucose/mannose-6-phosphate isomerase